MSILTKWTFRTSRADRFRLITTALSVTGCIAMMTSTLVIQQSMMAVNGSDGRGMLHDIFLLLRILTAVSSGLSLYINFLVTIEDRGGQYRLLLALGTTRRQFVHSLLTEALALLSVCFLVGIGGGILLVMFYLPDLGYSAGAVLSACKPSAVLWFLVLPMLLLTVGMLALALVTFFIRARTGAPRRPKQKRPSRRVPLAQRFFGANGRLLQLLYRADSANRPLYFCIFAICIASICLIASLSSVLLNTSVDTSRWSASISYSGADRSLDRQIDALVSELGERSAYQTLETLQVFHADARCETAAGQSFQPVLMATDGDAFRRIAEDNGFDAAGTEAMVYRYGKKDGIAAGEAALYFGTESDPAVSFRIAGRARSLSSQELRMTEPSAVYLLLSPRLLEAVRGGVSGAQSDRKVLFRATEAHALCETLRERIDAMDGCSVCEHIFGFGTRYGEREAQEILLTDLVTLRADHHQYKQFSATFAVLVIEMISISMFSVILNAIHMSRLSRQQEYVVLESLGIDLAQKTRMLFYESYQYTVRSALASVLILIVLEPVCAYLAQIGAVGEYLTDDADLIAASSDLFSALSVVLREDRSVFSIFGVILPAAMLIFFVVFLCVDFFVNLRLESDELLSLLKDRSYQ